jgi:hypothetical protein
LGLGIVLYLSYLAGATLPIITVSGPKSGARITAPVTVAASVQGDYAIAYVIFVVDDKRPHSTNTLPYKYNLDPSTLSNGAHWVSAEAYTRQGLLAASKPIKIIVANPKPQPVAPAGRVVEVPAAPVPAAPAPVAVATAPAPKVTAPVAARVGPDMVASTQPFIGRSASTPAVTTTARATTSAATSPARAVTPPSAASQAVVSRPASTLRPTQVARASAPAVTTRPVVRPVKAPSAPVVSTATAAPARVAPVRVARVPVAPVPVAPVPTAPVRVASAPAAPARTTSAPASVSTAPTATPVRVAMLPRQAQPRAVIAPEIGSDRQIRAAVASPRSGQVLISIDGQELTLDVPATMMKDQTYAPFRAVMERLGATVTWSGPTRTAQAVKGPVRIELQAGSRIARVNGRQVTLDRPVELRKGRTMASLRFCCESAGLSLTWNPAERRAEIVTEGTRVGLK